MINWDSIERVDRLSFLLVSPHNPDSVIGELTGVVLDDCSITEGYETDTRISAKVTTEAEDDGYIDYARIRIVHEVGEYREELITGFVTEINITNTGEGFYKREYSLDSSLFAAEKNIWGSNKTVGKNAQTKYVVRDWLQSIGLQCDISKAIGHRYKSSRVYEVGTTVLSSVFDMCNYDRVSVNGHGVITLTRYISPSSREATLDIKESSILGDISVSSERYTKPGAVLAMSGDKKKTAVAQVSKSAPTSFAKRGFLIVETVNVDGNNPPRSKVRDTAKNSLAKYQDFGRVFECSIMWHALHQGDIVTLPYGGKRIKCLVRSVEKNFSNMTEKLTLDEVSKEWID